jgi:hypothetical protein
MLHADQGIEVLTHNALNRGGIGKRWKECLPLAELSDVVKSCAVRGSPALTESGCAIYLSVSGMQLRSAGDLRPRWANVLSQVPLAWQLILERSRPRDLN